MKRDNNIKTSLSLRAVAGAYLLYQIFGMIKEFGKMAPKDQPKYLIFIVLFIVADAVILGTTARTWYKLNKEEKQQAQKMQSEEQTETADQTAKEELEEPADVSMKEIEKTEDETGNK